MRIPVIEGDRMEEVLVLLRSCGHEPIVVQESEVAGNSAGGLLLPPVVVTHHASDRAGVIQRLRGRGSWVIGVATEEHLDRLAGADDWLPLPATATALRARLRVVGGGGRRATLVSGLAHEINNPLAITMANLEFAIGELAETSRVPDVQETTQALREALEGAERIRRIMKELRVFAHRDRDPVAATPLPAAVSRRGQVLCVDDEPRLARLVQRILAADHDVVSETSAHDAVRRISGGERFDVILCDLMMPGISGMELHAELGTVAPGQQACMVFMTGGAFTAAAEEFLERENVPWLTKPFEAATLKAVIASRLS